MKSPIRVLYLDNTFTFGGAIISLGYLVRALDERFQCVVVSGQPIEYLRRAFEGQVVYHYIPKLPWIDNRIYRRIAPFPLFKLKAFARLLTVLRSLFWICYVYLPEAIRYYNIGRRHKIDLVHLNNILGSQLPGIMAAKLLGVPCVAHLRDFEEVSFATRLYARWIDHHIAISGAIADNLRDLGVPEEKITLVHDALDLENFATADACDHLYAELNVPRESRRYGLFGRIIQWKGVREFILASQQVARQVPGAIGFIVGGASDGDESYEVEMKKLVADLGLTGKVVFLGYRDQVPPLMNFMDVVVHASTRAEPFGMVVIEGMAMGKPVVATRGGGPLDIVVDGETGTLVQPGDPDDLAAAIVRLLQEPGLAREMGGRGLARVREHFDSRMYADKMQDVYAKQMR
ncbi:glycosyltransferase family 4 protein [Geomonas oryzisoli]|uniref:Glycosyltransferase family 4 protein n=1 Tax=Geomonas oryzisoli TaxID=2847992 RepID=A0ABX8J2X1_9BACT|nr:glycosyltransferase family 4 protein [Geomonas oryzisoli]QWV91844.1 glycosyltransferase family 4 protein [Geomonas oryzisoli]